MLSIDQEWLFGLLGSHLLALVRILGVFSSAPLFGNRAIPPTMRIALGLSMTVLMAPSLPVVALDLLAWPGLLALIRQFLIGIAMGFSMSLIMTAVELSGELISMTMGLGFATFFDPHSQGHSSSLSQYLATLSLLIFIGSDLHLQFIETLANSFISLPLDGAGLERLQFKALALQGGQIFSLALQLALPILTALLIVNMTLGVLTRAAPQLNLFGIGFPLTLLAGYLLLYLISPYWGPALTTALQYGSARPF